MKRVAIVQSCYIPWKGYFDLIRSVDQFVLYDHAQFTKRDWRNRNKIKTPQGVSWLTIPIKVKGRFQQSILESEIDGNDWASNHWKSILHNYKKAPYFNQYNERFHQLYLQATQENLLSRVNYNFIIAICEMLGINTAISWSTTLKEGVDKTEQLIYQCQLIEATQYISGPLAKKYIETDKFAKANIQLNYFEYPAYPTYQQLHGDFSHEVSIIDLIFNTGPNAMHYIHTGTNHER